VTVRPYRERERRSYLARRHHHAATNSVQGIRADTGTSGDAPAEREGGKEVALKRALEDDGLQGVVHAEVQTAVDDDAEHGGTETTVETGNAVRGEGLAVDVDQAVELALTTLLGGLGVVGETGTGVVQRVDEHQGGGTGHLLGSDC
jgi:hypothetical protein